MMVSLDNNNFHIQEDEYYFYNLSLIEQIYDYSKLLQLDNKSKKIVLTNTDDYEVGVTSQILRRTKIANKGKELKMRELTPMKKPNKNPKKKENTKYNKYYRLNLDCSIKFKDE